ncbi:hypothetical protein [Bradyrhizobium lablabi]|uniref:hypothetical protein n=1 Tax=Bradyrhizobium lablabi TaxID=722472 RepID=UPI0018D3A232|nr:hypothetical protein [Bradyrhizobium lablabi]
MDKEDDRIAAIFAANLNPLIDAADFDVHSLLDAVRGLNREGTRAELLAISAKAQSAPNRKNRQHGNCKQADFGDPEHPFHRRAALAIIGIHGTLFRAKSPVTQWPHRACG